MNLEPLRRRRPLENEASSWRSLAKPAPRSQPAVCIQMAVGRGCWRHAADGTATKRLAPPANNTTCFPLSLARESASAAECKISSTLGGWSRTRISREKEKASECL